MSPRIAVNTVLAFLLLAAAAQAGHETLWIEAEYLDGIEGYCWPMARNNRLAKNSNDNHWGISGPGWAAEWNQGGESGWLSIACGGEDDRAVATKEIEAPSTGTYYVWVRYRDNREMSERFQVRLEQPGAKPWTATYGTKPVIEEDNVMKLYWEWAFGWERHEAGLKKGTAKLSLLSAFKEPSHRQVDVIVLTTDYSYRPVIKDRPKNYAWDVLEQYRGGGPDVLDPLARGVGRYDAPKQWTPKTFEPGFLYLWNVSASENALLEEKDAAGNVRKVSKAVPPSWMRGDPNGILYPHGVRPGMPALYSKFVETYAGKKDVPIFSDPRIVPVFHGVGPAILGVEGQNEVQATTASLFMKWLDAGPNRRFGALLNYQPNKLLTGEAKKAFFEKYGDRFVGGISGENLGYFGIDHEALKELDTITERRQYVDECGKIYMKSNDEKYRAVFGDDLAKVKNPYAYTIPCQSCGATAFYNLCYLWGAETVGHEAIAGTGAMLGMRTAFLRGAARQHGKKTAVYRSCNFGDSSTMFTSEISWYTKTENIFDNYYSVYSGAGMTWYKMDIWYQYMAGAALFYHEQGFDEFWLPGGTTAAGRWDLRLSPKGKLVDRFLRTTAEGQNFDRGTPFTPVGVLVDYAHGWDPIHNLPKLWGPESGDAPAAKLGLHDRAMFGLFWTLYAPIGPVTEKPVTGLNQTYVHGVFGDIFDVIYAYPAVERWTTIDTYPAVIVGGDITLTEAEGKRLARYIRDGGTLLVAAEQLRGRGAAAVGLPNVGTVKESDGYYWGIVDGKRGRPNPSQRFRFAPIQGGQPLVRAANGGVLCAAFDRGKGRLIYLSVPYALGIDEQPIPVLAHLVAHLTRGLMPIRVRGDVEWAVNKNKRGWMVTLLNTAGQIKTQQGISPTDFRHNCTVTVTARVPIRTARDRLMPADRFEVKGNRLTCVVPAGGVRILELR